MSHKDSNSGKSASVRNGTGYPVLRVLRTGGGHPRDLATRKIEGPMEMPATKHMTAAAAERGEFAALFATLDQPVDGNTTDAGYSQLLCRMTSPSFQRDTLKGRS